MIDRIQQELLTVVAERLFSNTASMHPDETVLTEAKKQAVYSLVAPVAGRHNIAQSICVLHAHHELYQLLSSHSIPCVMIKGWASAFYYPNPMLRQLGDVDFFIPLESREKTASLMLENGYTLKGDKSPHHWAYIKDEIEYELHWRLNGAPEGAIGQQIETFLQDIYENARIVDTLAGSFAIPSDFHNGIITILHIARHMTKSGMGLRHLCDWAVFVDSMGDFEHTFKNCFTELGVWRFARLMTAICVKYLGLKEQTWTLDSEFTDELLEYVLLDILGAGNFGHERSVSYSSKLLGSINEDGRINTHGKLYYMFRSLNDISQRHVPITKKCPILLPFGWIYVTLEFIIRVLKGKKKALNPVKTISEAKERESLYAAFQLFE